MVSQEEIVRQAQQKANEMMTQAQQKSARCARARAIFGGSAPQDQKRGLPSAWARCGRRASFFGILPAGNAGTAQGIIDRKKGENAEVFFPFAYIGETAV